MNRYTGGVISATAPTVSQASASGVWNLEEAQYYQKAGQWPDGSGADPYFGNTTLLLHGDGTNGAQNNTFVDSSINVLSVTRTGNTTQGSFSPYLGPGNWSVFFDGTGDYLTGSGSAALAFGAGDFTLEMWIYPTAGTSKMLYDARPSAAAGVYPTLYINASNAITYFTNGSDRITGASPVLNTWQHVAVVRASGVTKLYINGTQSGSSYTDANTYINGAARPIIGADGGNVANQNYAGYISNLRVVVGTAIYTTTFTPPTTPLLATTRTTLLTCNNNAGYSDISAANNAFTPVGGTLASKFSPFTLYEISPAGYSGYFDGTGDYVALPAGTGASLGTGDFTIEAWVFPTARVTNSAYIISQSSYGVGSDFAFWITSTGILQFYMLTGGAGNIVTSTGTISLGAWTHVAISRSGTSFKLFINGTNDGSLTGSQNITNSYTPITIANSTNNTGSVYFPGSISNLRVTKNQALYTTNFTPSTTPLTTTSQGATAANVFLLTCQSTTFIDNSTNAYALTVFGNAQPVNANPFTDTVTGPAIYLPTTYLGSGYFDGSGDYLTVPVTAGLAFGTGNFTFETWIYTTSTTNLQYIYDNLASGDGIGTGRFAVDITATGTLRLVTGAAATVLLTSAAGAIVANRWYHIAITRSGTTGYMFINGALANTATVSTNFLSVTASGTDRPIIGSNGGNLLNQYRGYLSNLRVVTGTALYTSAFSPPTAPLTAITGTQLLFNMANGGIFDTTAISDLETVGSVQISTSVVKYGSGSISYPVTGSYLTFKGGLGIYNGATSAGNSLFVAGNTFTMEAWMYPTTKVSSAGFYSTILGDVNPLSSGAVLYWCVGLNSSGVPTVAWNDGTAKTAVGTTVISNNTWTHLAFVSVAGALTVYVNGVAETLSGTTTITTPSSTTGRIVSNGDRTNYWLGNLDELRVTNGVARYTTNFTPPGGPFPNF